MTVVAEAVAAGAPAPRGDGGRRSRGPRRRGQGALVAMSLPGILTFLFFNIGPLLAVFILAFASYDGLLSKPEFVGLDNFREMIEDPTFWNAAKITGMQMLVLLPILMPVSFMLGYYLSTKPPLAGLLRVNLFAPALISTAAKAMVFFAILAPTGVLNGALTSLGLEQWARPWLADPETAFWCIIFVNLWNGIGYTAVLFNARLSSIPDDILMAAEIDGAGHWTKMWRICFPMSISYFGVLTMLQFLWILFTSATDILLLTRGGPGETTTTWSYLLYAKAFVEQEIGYSQAVGVVLFALGVLGIVVIRRVFRQNY